mgnify:FL=1
MRNFFVSFRKNAASPGFLLCVAMTVLLLFAAEVYYDFGTQTHYSVFRALTYLTPDERAANYELCSQMVIKNAYSGWFSLFAPIIAVFCFVPTLCTERGEKAVRFQIFRTTRLKYSLSQFFSGVISGGAAISLGYIIFAALVMGLFPDIGEMSEFAADVLLETTFDLPYQILKMFLFGAFWSIPAMLLTSVLNNKYLIMCIPFFLKYGLKQLHQKISQDAFSAANTDKNAIALANAINPDGILWVYDETRLVTWLVFGISAALMFAAFIIINRKRVDCGA